MRIHFRSYIGKCLNISISCSSLIFPSTVTSQLLPSVSHPSLSMSTSLMLWTQLIQHTLLTKDFPGQSSLQTFGCSHKSKNYTRNSTISTSELCPLEPRGGIKILLPYFVSQFLFLKTRLFIHCQRTWAFA